MNNDANEPATLASLHKANLARAKVDRLLAFTTYPELYNPIFFSPCTVRILMVTDGFLSFGNDDFGLAELLEILSESPGPYVRFAVTTAHRSDGFNFAQPYQGRTLNDYDELWMFGASASPLDDAELKAIARFMDQGKGVFATGDHENLGVGMCGQIPRVRTMRKWYYPNPGPQGEPVAPIGDPFNIIPALKDRHDTLQQGHDGSGNSYQFNDQSDDVPQPIEPEMYSTPAPWYAFRGYSYPHPVLCGPQGIINILPDHAHEGECYEPIDLTKTYTFGDYTCTEYPELTFGGRLAPEVIAWARVIGGHTTDNKPVTVGKTFGVIGAYDGHRVTAGAQPGRVVVDATWHHFVNINLIGTGNSADGILKSRGFKAEVPGESATVRQARKDKYDVIKAYFRNIAVWLAPKQSQSCMFNWGLWGIRWSYPLAEELASLRRNHAFEELSPVSIFQIGATARDALGKIATCCFAVRWIVPAWEEVFVEIPLFDPWRRWPESPRFLFSQPEIMVDAALGGMMVALAMEFPDHNDRDKLRAQESMSKVVTAGAAIGLRALQQFTQKSLDDMQTCADVLKRSGEGRSAQEE